MKPMEYFGVAAQQVTQHGAHVLKIEGTFLAASAGRYLQVHDSVGAPAANAVPLRNWPLDPSSNFFQTFSAGELALAHGLYIGISTTDGTWTASADTMDLTVELTDPESPSGTTFAGDNVTARTHLSVWNDGAGPHNLLRLLIKELLGAAGYIFIFRYGADPAPIFIGIIKGNQTLDLSFGIAGFDPTYIDANGVKRNGCDVYVYDDAAHTLVDLNKATIIAEYK